MERFSKNTKGITLIALVVTIIVLLILVAVSINLISGEDGILQRTEDAKIVTEIRREEEQIKIAASIALTDNVTNKKITHLTYAALYNELMGKDENGERKYPNIEEVKLIEGPMDIPDDAMFISSLKENKSILNTLENLFMPTSYAASRTPYREEAYEEGDSPIQDDEDTLILGDDEEYTVGVLIVFNTGRSYIMDAKYDGEPIEETKTEFEDDSEVDYTGKTVSASQLNPNRYGDKVIYSANEVEDWQIFYSDNENIYIIPTDCVPVERLQNVITKTGMKSNGDYVIEWASDSPSNAFSTGWDKYINKYLLSGYNSNWDSRLGMKAATVLLNTDYWSEFKDALGYGDWAIGGPTLEMFIKSWNKKGNVKIYYNTDEDYGTYVGIGGENTINEVLGLSNTKGYNDTLYFPRKEKMDNCSGYYLASPSAFQGGNQIRNVEYYGDLSGGYVSYSSYYGVRPLVCLKSDVKLTGTTTDGKTTWTLSK